MIKVKVIKDSDMIKSISILGHAMYADFGKDIVCSAVSSITTTTINGSLSLDKESLSYEVSKDGLVIENIKNDKVTQTLLKNMISLLKELENDYPANVEVK